MELLDLIFQLPPTSRLHAAQLNDPEIAQEIARAERERESKGEHSDWSPSLLEWNLHAQLLREIRETLVAIHAAQFSTTFLPAGEGKLKAMKAPTVPKLPAPRTAVDKIKESLSRQAQMEIVALFAPHALDEWLPAE